MAVYIDTSTDQQCDANGVPMSGCKIYVYAVESTTLLSLFSDSDLETVAPNPITCNSAGRHDMRYIATGSYKIVIKTSDDVPVYTRDNIDPGVPIGTGVLAIANGGTGAATAGAALTALGGASDSELADLAADVAALSGAQSSSEKTHIATGTTAQRPAAPVVGDIRYNTTTTKYENYFGSGFDNVMLEAASAAAAADIKAETAAATFIRADRLPNSDRVAKAWANITYTGATPALTDSFNCTSIAANATGRCTVTFTTGLPNANYCVVATARGTSPSTIVTTRTQGTTTVQFDVQLGGVNVDPTGLAFVVFGDFS